MSSGSVGSQSTDGTEPTETNGLIQRLYEEFAVKNNMAWRTVFSCLYVELRVTVL